MFGCCGTEEREARPKNREMESSRTEGSKVIGAGGLQPLADELSDEGMDIGGTDQGFVGLEEVSLEDGDFS